MSEDSITSFLHSRGAITVATFLLICLTLVAYTNDSVMPLEGNRALAFTSTNLWLPQGVISLSLNLIVIVSTAIAMQTLNKELNLMRSMTTLWPAMFLVAQCAIPSIDCLLNGGTLLAALFLISTALLFSCYDRPERRRPVFMIFTILSLASLFQYGYMFFIPIFIIGLVQMKIFSLKTLVAALLGIITPQWILFGSGLLSVEDVAWPEFVSSLSVLDVEGIVLLLLPIAATALIGIGFFVGNFMKLLSYNARTRAFNGFLAIMLPVTIFLSIFDYHNISLYWPLLNMLAAYQTAHFFTSRRFTRSYIPILIIVAMNLTFYSLATF